MGKKKCVIESPVPSQCVTSTVLNKPKGLMSVATKVAIQMNCKLGGEPWAVKIPMKDTMIIGYDTYHDTLHKGKSVGAVVASESNLHKILECCSHPFIPSAGIRRLDVSSYHKSPEEVQ